MKTIIYSTLILVIFTIGAHSLQCYVCTNQGSAHCGHGADVSSEYLKECNAKDAGNPPLPANTANKTYEYTVCRKMVTKVDFDVNDNKATDADGIIKRSCGYDEVKYVGECYYRGGLGGRIDVCTCTEKGCNGSDHLGSGVTAILVPIVAALVQALRS